MNLTRTQVYLDPFDHKILKLEARANKVSLASLIRKIIKEHFLKEGNHSLFTKDDYMSIVGLGRSGGRDISARHDLYLGEALNEEYSN